MSTQSRVLRAEYFKMAENSLRLCREQIKYYSFYIIANLNLFIITLLLSITIDCIIRLQ